MSSSSSDTVALLKRFAGQPKFIIGDYEIVSQQPGILPKMQRDRAVELYLPQFLFLSRDIQSATGYRWKNTSYIRKSPSHQLGQAFDLAPDIAKSSESHYAVYQQSDPVLYKREALVKKLQTLRDRWYSPNHSNTMGIFIEPDHLHLQVMAVGKGERYPTSVIKWQVAKAVYGDTIERMARPVLKEGDDWIK